MSSSTNNNNNNNSNSKNNSNNNNAKIKTNRSENDHVAVVMERKNPFPLFVWRFWMLLFFLVSIIGIPCGCPLVGPMARTTTATTTTTTPVVTASCVNDQDLLFWWPSHTVVAELPREPKKCQVSWNNHNHSSLEPSDPSSCDMKQQSTKNVWSRATTTRLDSLVDVAKLPHNGMLLLVVLFSIVVPMVLGIKARTRQRQRSRHFFRQQTTTYTHSCRKQTHTTILCFPQPFKRFALVLLLMVACLSAPSRASFDSDSDEQRQDHIGAAPPLEEQQDSNDPGSAPPLPEQPTTHQQTSNGLLVLCSVDGTIYALDAWSGQFRSSSRAGVPLITRSNHDRSDETDEDPFFSAGTVHPGLDGKLYWQPPNTGEGDTPYAASLEPMPITIPALLDHPVKTCTKNEAHCGLLMAERMRTTMALDTETGDLVWAEGAFSTAPRMENDDDDDDDNNNNDGDDENDGRVKQQNPHTVVLQRQDYIIKHLSRRSGRQIWNVTIGSFQAVDFGRPKFTNRDKTDGHAKPQASHPRIDDDDDLDDDFIQDDNHGGDLQPDTSFPWLRFSKSGHQLTALLPEPNLNEHEPRTVLWRIESPHVLTAVFGIQNHQWKAVHVLDEIVSSNEDDFMLEGDYHESFYPEKLLLPSGATTVPFDASRWWKQQQQQQHELRYRCQKDDEQGLLPLGHGPKRDCSPGGICPDLKKNPPEMLQLPALPVSPPALKDELLASTTTTTEFSTKTMTLSRYDTGLWMGILVGVALTLGLAGFVFSPNHHHLNNNSKTNLSRRLNSNILTAEVVTSTTPSLQMNSSQATPITSCVSFPGAIRQRKNVTMKEDDDAVAATGGGRPSLPVSDPAASVLPDPGAADRTVSTSTVPRVHYSRYASDFTELQALGRGGFGSVFQCRNNLDGREYAMKKVLIRGNDKNGGLEQELSRVLREVKILAVLDHPHIIRYYTAWLETEEEDDGTPTNGTSTCKIKSEDDPSFSLAQSFSSSVVDKCDESKSAYSVSRRVGQGWSSSSEPTSSRWSKSWMQKQQQAAAAAPWGKEDCGIIFEDSSAKGENIGTDKEEVHAENYAAGVLDGDPDNHPLQQISESRDASLSTASGDEQQAIQSVPKDSPGTRRMKHTLYIQMQLCRFDTVADFLANKKARQGSEDSAVDIPTALGLLTQIAKAVQHVHEKGLIHRDLKPSNCFMDEQGIVKVGDFGLSRETSDSSQDDAVAAVLVPCFSTDSDDHHTAGVGTRLYASPEQTEGSSYDASTDVWALGIILFELCYPMYTGMERNVCLSKLRQTRQFPSDWDTVVGPKYAGELQELITSMLESRPSFRPKASDVVGRLVDILGELTILSPKQYARHNGNSWTRPILLRVESIVPPGNALPHCLWHIQDAASVDVLQSGMATEQGVTVLEFALRPSSNGSSSSSTKETAGAYHDATTNEVASRIVHRLERLDEILRVRQVSAHEHLPPTSPFVRAQTQ